MLVSHQEIQDEPAGVGAGRVIELKAGIAPAPRMAQSFDNDLSQHHVSLLGVVLLSIGTVPALHSPLSGRTQRAGGRVDGLGTLPQLFDDLIRIHGTDRRVTVAVNHERRDHDLGFMRLKRERPRRVDG